MIIRDGTGNQYAAKVTDEGLLRTYTVIEDEIRHINEEHKECYSIIISKTPVGTGDCFFYLKNNSDYDLTLVSMSGRVASKESIQVKGGDTGTPVGGSANAPVNRNLASGNTIDSTVLDGTNITGLSGGVVLDQIFYAADTESKKHRWNSGIIVPKNKTITLYAVTGAIALNLVLAVYYHKV